MEPVEKREFLASYQQYKDFISSNLWLDLQIEIKAWIDDLHGYLENETDPQDMCRFQGRLQACRQLLSLPERMLATIEITHEGQQREQESVPPDSDQDGYYLIQLQKWAGEDEENG